MQRIYLDYAASTPVDPVVLKAMRPYFSKIFGNPGSLHREGQKASAAVFKARVQIAKLIGARYSQIIFTGSATEANNLALRGVVQAIRHRVPRIKKPRIIVSSIEHESVLETAADLGGERAEIVFLPVSKDGLVNLKKLKDSLNERTVLVSVMYANNEIGSIQPVAEIGKIIREFRKKDSVLPLFHSDAVQALQYLDCDVNNLCVDFMTFSAHKVYGPKGIGALYIENPELIRPTITGGGQEEGLRSGTENTASIVGFAKALEFVVLRRSEEAKRVSALTKSFWDGIEKICPKARLNGPAIGPGRLSNNLNVAFPGVKAEDMLVKLDLMGIAASTGSACRSRAAEPSPALSALGLGGKIVSSSLRFTLGRPTSNQEIDKTLKVVKNILYE